MGCVPCSVLASSISSIYIFGSYNCPHPDYPLGYSNGHLISHKCMEEITPICAANREAKVLTLEAGRYAAQLV